MSSKNSFWSIYFRRKLELHIYHHNDKINQGQECAKRCAAAPSLSSCPVQESCTKSDSPEESVRGGDTISSPVQDNLQATRKSGFARAGDSIIPALLNLLPPHTVIQWQDKDDIFHTKMVEEIDTYMLEQILGCAYWQYDSWEEIMIFTRRPNE